MLNKKQMFTRNEVKEIIWDVLEAFNNEPVEFWFEERLNDRWLNSNNWANFHLYDEYIDDKIEVFL